MQRLLASVLCTPGTTHAWLVAHFPSASPPPCYPCCCPRPRHRFIGSYTYTPPVTVSSMSADGDGALLMSDGLLDGTDATLYDTSAGDPFWSGLGPSGLGGSQVSKQLDTGAAPSSGYSATKLQTISQLEGKAGAAARQVDSPAASQPEQDLPLLPSPDGGAGGAPGAAPAAGALTTAATTTTTTGSSGSGSEAGGAADTAGVLPSAVAVSTSSNGNPGVPVATVVAAAVGGVVGAAVLTVSVMALVRWRRGAVREHTRVVPLGVA